MKKITTLFLLLSLQVQVWGQCSIAVPANAMVVSTMQGSVIANGQTLWICNGGLAAVTGNGNTVLVEEMGLGTLIGDNNILITQASGAYVEGNNNSVYILDPEQVADLGSNTQITACPVVSFDYTNAPSTGCGGVGLEEQIAGTDFSFFPNPMEDELNLLIEGTRIDRARIFDMHGRMVVDRSGGTTTKLDVRALPGGPYILVVDTEHGTIIRRVQKN